ncbi:hypothetical protein [Kiloniella antarctica]|uniref:Sulfatase N-terminal domain-containing protein n=1 Tax=Kiloniella antarctica TaxID=1550907 RepID=A0ABW5BME7_9PROT
MRYLIFAVLLLATLTACQTTKNSSGKIHGAYYVNGHQSDSGTVNGFTADTNNVLLNRDPKKTTLLIYNHGTVSSGIHQKCHTDWMPSYVRLLTLRDPSIIAYYFCSQEAGGNSGDSIVNQIHYKRGVEIARLSEKFQGLGISKDNIFLMGHSGGASASLMTASRSPNQFNSYIVTAPGYGYAYLGGARQHLNYGNLYNNWKTVIQRGKKSKGIVYAFPGDKYSPAKDLDFMKSMKNIDYRVLTAEDEQGCGIEEIHAYPWTDCFAKEQTLDILKYIQSTRTEYTVSAPPQTVKHEGINHPKHGIFYTSQDNPHRKHFGTYPTNKSFEEKFSATFKNRSPEKTVVFVYNHDLTNEGAANRCDPTNLPFYLRNLISFNARYVVYSFCAPDTINSLNKKTTDTLHNKTRLSELKTILNKLKDKHVKPGNIFLVGDNYGATTNILAAFEFGNKFNSHISLFPDRDVLLKRPHVFFDTVDALVKDRDEAARIASNAPGLIYSKKELLKENPLKNVAENNHWSFVVSGSCDSSQKVSYTDNCFHDKNKENITQFILDSLKQPSS